MCNCTLTEYNLYVRECDFDIIIPEYDELKFRLNATRVELNGVLGVGGLFGIYCLLLE